MDLAQEDIFGVKNQKKLIENNYTSRAPKSKPLAPQPQVFAKVEEQVTKHQNLISPVCFDNYLIYHYACFNLGQHDMLTVDLKADSHWMLNVQTKIYAAYNRMMTNVSEGLTEFCQKASAKFFAKKQKSEAAESEDSEELDVMKYIN